MKDDTLVLYNTKTDKDGYYVLEGVKLGEQSILFAFEGYEPFYVRNQSVQSGKQLEVNALMEESISSMEVLEDIVVRARKKKGISKFATVSATKLDVKTINQFAGSLFDIARMATNLPGVVVNSDSRNDIVIRGNSPSGLIWRLNDMDVPNPNHFGGLGVTGGPVSILNTSHIEKADFYTSAFPAEFGNGTSGVFDLTLRRGNSEKHEHQFQIGWNGFELGSEGYFTKKSRASYLFAARISIFQAFNYIGLFNKPTDFVPKYSDLTAKIDVPVGKKNNSISFFAIWGINAVDLLGSAFDDTNKEEFTGQDYNTDIRNQGSLYMTGLSYKAYLRPTSFIKFILGSTGQNFDTKLNSVNRNPNNNDVSYSQPDSIAQQLIQNNFIAHLYVNSQLNKRNLVKVGVSMNFIQAKYTTELLYYSPSRFGGANFDGSSFLLKPYATWMHKFNDKFQFSAGFHSMYYDISQSFSFEPRVGLSYVLNRVNKFSIGYGRHAQMQPIISYFFVSEQEPTKNNRNMGFTLSDQFVLSYRLQLNKHTSIKIEGYYQWLSNVPVDSRDSTFSMLNAGADFTIPVEVDLQNTGKGLNRGVEISINRNIEKGFYYLLTGSLFESTYVTSTGKTFPTVFDNRFVVNALLGKEWSFTVARKFPITLGGSMRTVYAGGRPYTDLVETADDSPGFPIYNLENTYGKRMSNYFRLDLRLYLRMNLSKKLSQEFNFELTNLTGRKNDWLPSYDAETNRVALSKQQGFRFVVFYKLYF